MPEKQPSSWLELADNGVDAAILIEGTISALLAIKKHSARSLDVIYHGVIRGIYKAESDPAGGGDQLLESTRRLEEITERSLRETQTSIWENSKEHFKGIYKTKKDTIKRANAETTDIPEQILSYDVGSYNVLASVVQKHLNDPKASKEKKANIQKLSDALDEIRAGAQTLASSNLSNLAIVSERVGALLRLGLFQMVPQNITALPIEAPLPFLSKIKKTIQDVIYKGKYSALFPLMSKSDAHKFMLAVIYDGIKTKKEEPKKHRKPNAEKRHKKKLEMKATKRIYNTYNPSMIEVFKHESGWNEWRQAHSTVVASYQKTDKRVDEGMDSLLKKITSKAMSQGELESRRLLRATEVGRKGLSYYDQIRSISTASNTWLQANLYRASRHFGSSLKQSAERISDDVSSKLPEDKTFQEAKRGMRSVKQRDKSRTHNTKKRKKGRSR